jgi:hypothetical protein
MLQANPHHLNHDRREEYDAAPYRICGGPHQDRTQHDQSEANQTACTALSNHEELPIKAGSLEQRTCGPPPTVCAASSPDHADAAAMNATV